MTPRTILFPLLGTGIIGGTIAGGYFFVTPNTIKELLTSEGTNLLDAHGNKNDKEWKILVDKHNGTKVTVKDSKEIQTINDLTINAGTDDAKMNQLKNKCKELFEKSITEKEKFKELAENWCTLKSPLLRE